MNKYGVTEHGFRRKLFSEILQEKRSKAIEIFGDDIDLSSTSFLGLLIENQSEAEASLWEEMEDVYLSAFVEYSTGHSLDAGGKYISTSRKPAVKSKGFITIEGNDGLTVPKGFGVARNDVVFETIERAKIENGTIEIPIRPIIAGREGNVPAMSIDKIINPIAGIDKVYNRKAIEGGLDIETDEEFRARYQLSDSRGGGSTVDAIRAALLDMDEVVDAFVKQNKTMETLDGIPPKSIAAYVFGADDKDVANTIMRSKAAGIESFGDTCVEVEDQQGEIHQIGFTRPMEVDVHVKLSIKPGEGLKSDTAIRRSVLNYIGGMDEDGIQYKGLKLGEDVVVSRLVAAVTSLGGIADIKVEIGTTDGQYQEDNVVLTTNQIARTGHVVINYDL